MCTIVNAQRSCTTCSTKKLKTPLCTCTAVVDELIVSVIVPLGQPLICHQTWTIAWHEVIVFSQPNSFLRDLCVSWVYIKTLRHSSSIVWDPIYKHQRFSKLKMKLLSNKQFYGSNWKFMYCTSVNEWTTGNSLTPQMMHLGIGLCWDELTMELTTFDYTWGRFQMFCDQIFRFFAF